MSKLCPVNGAQQQHSMAAALVGSTRGLFGELHLQRAGQRAPAGRIMPATQHPYKLSRLNEAALRARQSPALSLFNRLDGLVHQLQPQRDFFAQWPARVCQRLRRAAAAGQQPPRPGARSGSPPATNNDSCWNGRDFGGYSKPLAQFGSPITSSHPEVAVARTSPVSKMVLDIVARLKDIGAELARKSTRSPPNFMLELSGYSEALQSLELVRGPTNQNNQNNNNQHQDSKHSSTRSDLISTLDSALSAVSSSADTSDEDSPSSLVPSSSQQQQQPGEQPDGEAADSDGEPGDLLEANAGAINEEDQDDQDDQDDPQTPECMRVDCSDLVPAPPALSPAPDSSSSSSSNINGNNHVSPNDPEVFNMNNVGGSIAPPAAPKYTTNNQLVVVPSPGGGGGGFNPEQPPMGNELAFKEYGNYLYPDHMRVPSSSARSNLFSAGCSWMEWSPMFMSQLAIVHLLTLLSSLWLMAERR